MKSSDTVGVIIGRFQTPELHPGHRQLIEYVSARHQDVLVLVGITRTGPTEKNPLDFKTRELMLKGYRPLKSRMSIDLITDNRSDKNWSQQVDAIIRSRYGKQAILYGGRDSFIPHYRGIHETSEVDSLHNNSSTELRRAASETAFDSDEFRAGVIYGVTNQYPTVYSAVDVAIFTPAGRLLLGRKPGEEKFRFVGGFVDVTDDSDFAACRREAFEETGATIEPIKFITSMMVDDWRYRKEPTRKIMTRLYSAVYVSGPVKAGDDLEEVRWFAEEEIKQDIFVEEHIPLFRAI